ncbi:MAG: SMC-Scp complex subunit ScpB [Candidatus Bathyarchaeota archaeon]|nr:SMC-Scp complex subunit ScpB [Candidatus Bathyarchaeota archaeon]MDH5792268.1 SMC-Scp complex subunit ScpB [Candidatus Bathyarchaeota archaeon]
MTEVEKLAELEAILYASGRPLSLTTLCEHLRLQSEREVSDLIRRLSETYEQDWSPLEVSEVTGGRVVLQLKPDYTRQARRFSMKPLLTAGPLRTLSYVAYHQPVEQKQVADARGSQAYSHLRALEQMGLVSREKEGRNTIIRTTTDFADYLGLSPDRTAMRRQLRSIFRKLEVQEIEKK